jgi:hypothetical protein
MLFKSIWCQEDEEKGGKCFKKATLTSFLGDDRFPCRPCNVVLLLRLGFWLRGQGQDGVVGVDGVHDDA